MTKVKQQANTLFQHVVGDNKLRKGGGGIGWGLRE